MSDLPECYCTEMSDCNWMVSATLEVENANASKGPKTTRYWSMTKIPHPLANAVMFACSAVLDEKGVEIYMEMLELCNGDEGEAAAATIRKLVG